MGFFGSVVDDNEFEMDIPDAYSLNFIQACLDPSNESSVTLFVKPANEDHFFILCTLNKGEVQMHVKNVDVDTIDAFSLKTSGGEIHLTGSWSWEVSDDEQEHQDEHDCGQSDETDTGICVDEPPMTGKRKNGESNKKQENQKEIQKQASQTLVDEAGRITSSLNEAERDKPKKKQKKQPNAATTPTDDSPKIVVAKAPDLPQTAMKRWKVKPQNDEGVIVPQPKRLTKTCGIHITDFVVGKGPEPKLGSKVQITYEGFLLSGELFDSNLKRTKPFTFRKGTGQVVRGLDLGLDGLRIGGSREIIIPPELGYGRDGLGPVPGNATLVFRVTLVGEEKLKLSKR